MPITLDTPFEYSPGHGQAQETYNEVKIVFFSVDVNSREAMIRTEYGNTVSGTWIPGKTPVSQFVVENRAAHIGPGGEQIAEDAAYNILMGTSFTQLPTGSSVYDEVGISLYNYLLSKGIYEGTLGIQQ